MKNTFLFSVISLFIFGGADASICRLIPTKCYNTTMGNGYLYDTSVSASWDITSNCWGKKYICADALTDEYVRDHIIVDNRAALGRAEIAPATNADFDLTVLNGDCFGTRMAKEGGAQIKVDGNYVNVWCYGVLDDLRSEDILISETFENGDITTTQPSCGQLATHGYVNIPNGKCYGKYYNQDEYNIYCTNGNPTLVILNGVDVENIVDTDIKTKSAAESRFRTMYENAQVLHKKYFKE